VLFEILGSSPGIGGDISADFGIVDTIMSEVEDGRIIGELLVLEGRDCVENGGINTFHCASDDAWVQIALISIDAYTETTLLICGIKGSNTTTTCSLEDNIGLMLSNLS